MDIISNDAQLNHALSFTNKAKDVEGTIRERREKLIVCISLGAQLAQLERDIPSTKLRGIELAIRFPESRCFDAQQRTHCKWLYKALYENGHPDNDILERLGLREIKDICADTAHPTVIYRKYRKAKAKAKAT